LLVLIGVSAPAFAETPLPQNPSREPKAGQTLHVTSQAFRANSAIPREYTCEGADISPPLAWSNVPPDTKSIAVLVDDPDAPGGTVLHWLVTGLSGSATSLGKGAELPEGAIAVKNTRGQPGYMGPCPPSGRHRYRFNVFALDRSPGSPQTREDFENAIEGHVLAHGVLVGTYEKGSR
jgi:Raf kinase inhibitor-like YbhB/YbcL family protein